MKLSKFKFFFYIVTTCSVCIAGIFIGLCISSTTQIANAAPNKTTITLPEPNEINIGGGIEYKRIYVNGRYYVVFWNTCGLSAVREQ